MSFVLFIKGFAAVCCGCMAAIVGLYALRILVAFVFVPGQVPFTLALMAVLVLGVIGGVAYVLEERVK